MDFIGLTMVKNEEDIIEQFVRHNLQYFKKLYVFDHSSCDNTVPILTKLAGEGLPIVMVYDPQKFFVGYAQAEVMTSVLRLAIRDNGPAAYFPIDADEFLYLKTDVEELRQQIAALPGNAIMNVPLLSMAFPPEAGEELFVDAPKSFSLLEKWDKNTGLDVKLVVKVVDPAIGDQLMLAQGNHNAHLNGIKIQKDYSCDALRYIHVPVRSPEQAFRKFVCGWLSNVQKFGRNSGYASHWKIAFDKICEEDAYANTALAHMLNSIYTGPVNIENDFEPVDTQSLFKYELAYRDMRKKGLSVILRNIEADFDSLFAKMSQKT
jgi:hypothetical protein